MMAKHPGLDPGLLSTSSLSLSMLRRKREEIAVPTSQEHCERPQVWHAARALQILSLMVSSGDPSVSYRDSTGTRDTNREYRRHSHCPLIYHLVENHSAAMSRLLCSEREIQDLNVL